MLDIIILAAGHGLRMKSALPKVLHQLAGKPLLQHVIETARALSPENIYVVYGYQGEKIQQYFTDACYQSIRWIEQKQPLGTAHAVMQVFHYLKNIHPVQKTKNKKILILYGDVPLITPSSLEKLIQQTSLDSFGLFTAMVDNPHGFGRIIRDKNHQISRIIEEKDATPAQKAIQEINTGIYIGSHDNFAKFLPDITCHNQQQEYYLTDIFNQKNQVNITSLTIDNPFEIQGVNDRVQLNLLERYCQQKMAKALMLNGVSIMDPNRLDIRGNTDISPDVIIDINVILEGNITIATGSQIGSCCTLKNVTLGHNVIIRSNCVIEDAIIGDHCIIGPFARIRPHTVLSEKVSIGNFVELKNATIGAGSKIPHISYVGDTVMGEQVNFGAGAITCNYDGLNKHQTTIGHKVFIGADSQLIAPVDIADGAFIGAGSTITKNAPSHKLTLSRTKQQTLENWTKPVKKKTDSS